MTEAEQAEFDAEVLRYKQLTSHIRSCMRGAASSCEILLLSGSLTAESRARVGQWQADASGTLPRISHNLQALYHWVGALPPYISFPLLYALALLPAVALTLLYKPREMPLRTWHGINAFLLSLVALFAPGYNILIAVAACYFAGLAALCGARWLPIITALNYAASLFFFNPSFLIYLSRLDPTPIQGHSLLLLLLVPIAAPLIAIYLNASGRAAI